MATKVTLRRREYPSGKVALYLDFYPPVRNPKTMQMSRREYLGIYIHPKPTTREERKINEEKLRIAEGIRAMRELALLNEQYGFLDKTTKKMDFLKYFKGFLPKENAKWGFVYKHFSEYVKGSCKFEDLTVELCNGFRTYLLNTPMLRDPKRKLSRNSVAGYWSTFRGVLARAYKERYLSENINDYLEKVETEDTRREYLTAEEIKKRIGTAWPSGLSETMEVSGRDLVEGLPKTITLNSDEIASSMAESLQDVVRACKTVLEQTPPELASDIVTRGIVLTGGGALLHGIDELLRNELHIPVYVAENALTCVAEGTGILLENLERIR